MNNKSANKNKFLINLIKNGFESASVEDFISAKPDWEYLLGLSVREGVFYPFYKNLLALDGKGRLIPEEFRDKYKQTYYLHLSKSADFSEQVDCVLKRLDSLNIKVLLFKGPAIDSLIYDGYTRPRLDIDIVIRDEDMPEAEKALANVGYISEREEKDCIHPTQLDSKVFTCNNNKLIPLHVHRHLINNTFLTADGSLGMDMEDVWQETEDFKNYRNISVLKPELNIVYLSEHGLKHDFDQLAFLYEIERLIKYYKVRCDWKKVVTLAKKFGMEHIVYYGLYFVREILSAEIPDEVMDAVKPKKYSVGEKAFVKNILNNKQSRYSSYAVYLASRAGLLKKINFLFCTAFPPRFTLKDHLARISRSVLR